MQIDAADAILLTPGEPPFIIIFYNNILELTLKERDFI